MDFLKAEIARKKKQIEEIDVMQPNKKFFKRSDLALRQEEEYWKKHKRWKADEKEASVSKVVDAESDKDADKKKVPARKEVVKRLRERNEPIRLFGESDYDAFQRLKKLEMLQPEINKGFKNDMKAAMDQVDQAYLNEILHAGGSDPTDEETKASHEVKVKEDVKSFEDLVKLADKLGTGSVSLDSEVCLLYFKLILKIWGEELNARARDEKQSFNGKLMSATHSQTVTYIKPLLRKLKKCNLDMTILSCLVDIVKHLLDRHYLNANDAYLQMAIGNAPWPIGVTMVGIHARTGREKIFDRNVAHVLNDENQRKYIQAVKRLMTQSQKFFPTDPSRSVNFEGEVH